VPSKMKSLYQNSKVVNTRHVLLRVHVSYTVEVHKYHTNCRLTFESFTVFRVDSDLYLHLGGPA